MPPTFEESVFINCPFDEEFAPILQAIVFCVVYMGLCPRLAPENADSGAARIDRIIDLIRNSKFGIHDLSRCRSTAVGEYARMNMPFELGLDHACRRFGSPPCDTKAVLVLEHDRYDYQKSLSDISGWDIEPHSGSYREAILKVRGWLIAQAGVRSVGASRIVGQYATFLGWYWDREAAAGSSEEDIKRYPTREVVTAMQKWMELDQPT